MTIRLSALALACAMTAGSAMVAATPAYADGRDCGSNANVWHVRSRLGDAIEQLNHDRRDYGGHRASAMQDFERAQTELTVARAYALEHERANPACFTPARDLGGPAFEDPTRGQVASDRRIAGIDRYVGRLIAQLSRDEHDYDGHRVSAIRDMQAGQGELAEAERFARSHGN